MTRITPVFVALIAFAAVFGWAGAAEAKQCVWNKGWFVLNVKWYDRDDLRIARFANGELDLRVIGNARPLQEDQFPAAQGRCFTHPRGERAVAVLRVWGGEFFTGFLKGFLTPIIAAGTVGVSATVCAGTAGAGCPAAVAGTGAAAGLILHSIPNRREVFGAVVPRTDRWTDVWGSAFDPRASITAGGRF